MKIYLQFKCPDWIDQIDPDILDQHYDDLQEFKNIYLIFGESIELELDTESKEVKVCRIN